MQKPQRALALADAAARYRWETETKPQIARQARAKRATVFFEDEMSLATQGTVHQTWGRVGQTPGQKTYGRHKGVKAFGRVSNRNSFRYRVQTTYFTQASFLSFLPDFRANVEGFLIVIVDGAPYHKGVGGKDFQEAHRSNSALYYLPGYSPELNPQAQVWRVFRKQQSHNRSFTNTDELLVAARSGFRSLQHSSVLKGVYSECQNYFA